MKSKTMNDPYQFHYTTTSADREAFVELDVVEFHAAQCEKIKLKIRLSQIESFQTTPQKYRTAIVDQQLATNKQRASQNLPPLPITDLPDNLCTIVKKGGTAYLTVEATYEELCKIIY